MTILFSAGQSVTATLLNEVAPIFAQKSVAQSVTNSATLVNDNDLLFTLAANQTVNVTAHLVYSGSSTTNVGLRAAWSMTGTLAGVSRLCMGPSDAGGAQLPDNLQLQARPLTALGTNNLYTSGIVANAQFYAREELILTTGASGGTLQFQFAEFTATASTSISMLAGTFAVARYVA